MWFAWLVVVSLSAALFEETGWRLRDPTEALPA
jgi:hypothetical protein